jgi:endonuclease YncB( thermonuclease family)
VSKGLGAIFLSTLALLVAACNADTSSTPTATTAETGPTTTESEDTTAPTTTEAVLLVSRVIDGDTIDLDSGDRIRLVQIDAPERKGECYGKKAGAVLRQLLPVGTEVRIVRDRKLDNIDRYGRLLRYVFKAKKNINLVLVQKGAASVWYFHADKGRYAAKLAAAATKARDQRKGAWGACEASFDFERAWTVRQKRSVITTTEQTTNNCDPNYKGACLDPNAYDYDCAGGEGDGPNYVSGPVYVVGDDPFDLDRDGDGVACES